MNEQGKHNLAETNKQTSKIQRAPKAMPVAAVAGLPHFFFYFFFPIFYFFHWADIKKK